MYWLTTLPSYIAISIVFFDFSYESLTNLIIENLRNYKQFSSKPFEIEFFLTNIKSRGLKQHSYIVFSKIIFLTKNGFSEGGGGLKGFCQIFYRFFETLDAFGSFHFSAEPFLEVPSTTFFFSRVWQLVFLFYNHRILYRHNCLAPFFGPFGLQRCVKWFSQTTVLCKSNFFSINWLLRRRTNSNVLLQSGKSREFFGGYKSLEKRCRVKLQLQVASGKKANWLGIVDIVVLICICTSRLKIYSINFFYLVMRSSYWNILGVL
jgi:hypothetical protein